MSNFDVIVIGQGYAGLTAAKLAAQKGLRTANLEAEMFGGLIININELDPVPADAAAAGTASGVDLASNLAMENMDAGIEAISEQVTAIAQQASGGFVVTTDGGRYTARNVIIATGAKFRTLGIPGEAEFVGRGVSNCGDCDGPMFQGKEAVVVGGGDSAFQEAHALVQWCSRVTIVFRGEAPRAAAHFIEHLAGNPKVVLMNRTTPLAILGSNGVDGLRVSREGEGESTLACAGVFVFAGLEPNTACAPADLARDEGGCLVVSDKRATALPGLWAIGAVRAGFGGSLSDAAEDAALVVGAL